MENDNIQEMTNCPNHIKMDKNDMSKYKSWPSNYVHITYKVNKNDMSK
jgi:hypothetical protein